MSRWFMYHVAVLSFEILYNKDNLMSKCILNTSCIMSNLFRGYWNVVSL